MSRPRHKSKEIETQLRRVEWTAGWSVQYPSGHWGRIVCEGDPELRESTPLGWRCSMTVPGTTAAPGNTVGKIHRKLRRCVHGYATS
jgi:hypothetical protein